MILTVDGLAHGRIQSALASLALLEGFSPKDHSSFATRSNNLEQVNSPDLVYCGAIDKSPQAQSSAVRCFEGVCLAGFPVPCLLAII